MKLLFDANLSWIVVGLLNDLFPGSAHVRTEGLGRASDAEVWEFARRSGCVIVTKDSDFQELSVLRGHPPKVAWIRRGNCGTQTVAKMLRENHALLQTFAADPDLALLILL